MASSRPPTLITHAKRALRRAGVLRGERIVIALSGGRDSMALLDVLAHLREEHELRLFAHGVDHGLRSAAAGELDLAATFARTRGIPFSRSKLHLRDGGNLQARARDARYESLEKARDKHRARFIATAHHANDRAETFLIRLVQGSGLRGLGVLPLVDGPRLRPLIDASRSDIDAHVTRHAVPFSDDPSNDAPRFLRTRVRRELLPLLSELNPQIVPHLNALAHSFASKAEKEPPLPLPRATLDALRDLLLLGDRDVGNPEIWLPRGLVVRRDRSHVQGRRPVVDTPPQRRRRPGR